LSHNKYITLRNFIHRKQHNCAASRFVSKLFPEQVSMVSKIGRKRCKIRKSNAKNCRIWNRCQL